MGHPTQIMEVSSTSATADKVRVEESTLAPKGAPFYASDVQYLQVNDSNNLSYTNGQFNIDLSALQANQAMMDLQRSWWTVPVTLTMQSTGLGFNFMDNQFAVNLKSSVYSLINGMNVNLGEMNVITYQQHSNLFIFYNLLTKWNATDVQNEGTSLCFYKSDHRCLMWDRIYGLHNTQQYLPQFQGAGAVVSSGNTQTTNPPPNFKGVPSSGTVIGTATGTTAGSPGLAGNLCQPIVNEARLASMKSTVWCLQQLPSGSYEGAGPNNIVWPLDPTASYGNANPMYLTQSTIDNSRVSYCQFSGGTATPYLIGTDATATTLTYYMIYNLKLKYMHSLFYNMPLHKGARWTMTIYTHLPCSATVTVTSGTDVTLSGAAPTNYSVNVLNGYFPYCFTKMVDAGPSQPSANFFVYNTGSGFSYQRPATNGASYNFNFSSSIGVPSMKTSTMNICMVTMSAEAESQYTETSKRRKTVIYEDFYRYAPSGLQNVGSTGFQVQITPGIGRPRKLMVWPYLASMITSGVPASTGGLLPSNAYGGQPFNQLLSPWVTDITAPFAFVYNANVALGGKIIFQRPMMYSYDDFLREHEPDGGGMGAFTGNQTIGMKCSLISEMDWKKCYHFHVYSLVNHQDSSVDKTPTSIDYQGVSQCGQIVNMDAFVVYQRVIEIDIVTGQLYATDA